MSGIRHEGGVNWNLAVVRNVGTGGLMERERLKRWTRQSQSTEADPRGGRACSSEEARPTPGGAKRHKTILAIQDTSYFIYTSHPKTKGLGRMSLKKGKRVEKIFSNGLVMHACLGVTTDGLPIGLLDQHIFARKLNTKKRRKLADVTPIEEKESYRWLQSLRNAREIAGDTQVVTVCDREADIYEFFKLSEEIKSPVLVRAKVDRAINKPPRDPL